MYTYFSVCMSIVCRGRDNQDNGVVVLTGSDGNVMGTFDVISGMDYTIN